MTRRLLSYPPDARQIETSTVDCDVVIIGGGIAGLSVALGLPPDWRVILVTKNALGESNTRYAQGGLAAPVGADDNPRLHLEDTLAAGAGLVDEQAARVLVTEAKEAVAWLIETGTRFDMSSKPVASSALGETGRPAADLGARYDLAREAAHSRRRVLHAHGDATGAEIERALVQAVRQRPSAAILEDTMALDLLMTDRGTCGGIMACRIGPDGRHFRILARHGVVLANGGAGQLWRRTSNPAGATADGLALAARAGAVLADLEFVQFHPTVLVPPQAVDEPFLISEAVRGEGAYLRNAGGRRFMPDYHPDAELAPRDVVARAIQSEMSATSAPCSYLDLRHIPESEVRERFPSINAVCRRYGFDLAHDLIPVAPAAHYFMGGVVVDTWARTTLPGLYAVGEVACTGVHGANRLASNSLLEGLVFGRRAARCLVGSETAATWPTAPALPGQTASLDQLVRPQVQLAAPPAVAIRQDLREVMWSLVSLRRDGEGLQAAVSQLRLLAGAGPVDPETANMLFAAQAITACALSRLESRGGHYRSDYPDTDPRLAGRHTLAVPDAAPTDQISEGAASHVNV
jgi:L-aspartate oxidase